MIVFFHKLIEVYIQISNFSVFAKCGDEYLSANPCCMIPTSTVYQKKKYSERLCNWFTAGADPADLVERMRRLLYLYTDAKGRFSRSNAQLDN